MSDEDDGVVDRMARLSRAGSGGHRGEVSSTAGVLAQVNGHKIHEGGSSLRHSVSSVSSSAASAVDNHMALVPDLRDSNTTVIPTSNDDYELQWNDSYDDKQPPVSYNTFGPAAAALPGNSSLSSLPTSAPVSTTASSINSLYAEQAALQEQAAALKAQQAALASARSKASVLPSPPKPSAHSTYTLPAAAPSYHHYKPPQSNFQSRNSIASDQNSTTLLLEMNHKLDHLLSTQKSAEVLEDKLRSVEASKISELQSLKAGWQAKFQEESSSHKTALHALQGELSAASTKLNLLDNAEKKVEEARSVAQGIQKKLKASEKECERLATLNAQCNERISILENEIANKGDAANDTVQALESEKNILLNKLETQSTELQVVSKELEKLKTVSVEEKESTGAISQELEKVKSQLNVAETKYEESQGRIALLEKSAESSSNNSDDMIDLFKEVMNDIYFQFQDSFDEQSDFTGKEVIVAIRKTLKKNTTKVVEQINSLKS